MRLKDKVAIVTGSGRGIGKAIAKAFAHEGAKVVITSRTSAEIKLAAAEISAGGGEAIAIVGDISKAQDVAAIFKTAQERFGPVDILVNNAAVVATAPICDTADEVWEELMAINLTGPFLCAKEAFKGMIQRRRGRIINISSIAGRQGTKNMSAYCVSKHGILGLTQALAEEGREYGIYVNAICPGSVDTKMLALARPWDEPSIVPEEIAAVAVFLACDESSAITGAAIDAFGLKPSP